MFHMKSPSLVLGEWSGDVMLGLGGVKSASSPAPTGELRLVFIANVRLSPGKGEAETFSAD